MSGEAQHAACVDAWLARTTKDLPTEEVLHLLEAAFIALWTRTATTLGEVTLTAIAERVLHNAAATYPPFASVRVEPTGGISFREFHQQVSAEHDHPLLAGARFVLIEFLTVLGNLTAEILTPELHTRLGAVTPPKTDRNASQSDAPSTTEGTRGEGTRS